MFRAIIRFIGFWLLAGAFIGVVADGARSIAAGEIIFVPAGNVWQWLSPQSLPALRDMLQESGVSFLWDPALVTVLTWPASLIGLAIGIVLLWAGRRGTGRDEVAEIGLR